MQTTRTLGAQLRMAAAISGQRERERERSVGRRQCFKKISQQNGAAAWEDKSQDGTDLLPHMKNDRESCKGMDPRVRSPRSALALLCGCQLALAGL